MQYRICKMEVLKRNWLTAGLATAATAYELSKRARQQVQLDSATKFPTWSEISNMRRKSVPTRRILTKRRRFNIPRGRYANASSRRVVRCTAVTGIAFAAATTGGAAVQCKLSDVVTSDLQAAYTLYRIRKVVLHLVPRVDPANSGLANNYQFMVAACCDPEDATAPTGTTAVTVFENSYQKFVQSGSKFRYTFYPKAVNAVGNAGATAYVGSYGMNPWLQLNGLGIAIPHLSLKMGFNTGSSTTVNFDYYLEYHFDVKGLN